MEEFIANDQNEDMPITSNAIEGYNYLFTLVFKILMKCFHNYLSGLALTTSTATISEMTNTRVDSSNDGIINDQSQPIATKATEGNDLLKSNLNM